MKRRMDRTHRIADLVQQSLAHVLLRDMGDSRFRLVTVAGVVVTRDLSHAKIYVSVFSEDQAEIKAIITALNNANKSIRYHLAHMVTLRIVPELKFVYDASTAHGFHISHLIDAALEPTKKS